MDRPLAKIQQSIGCFADGRRANLGSSALWGNWALGVEGVDCLISAATSPNVEAAIEAGAEGVDSWWGQCVGQHFHKSSGYLLPKGHGVNWHKSAFLL